MEKSCQKKQPNVLLVFVDNQPANMLGCAGNTEIHTPNLDRLAENAVRFSEAYCPNAMCSPCRASVLTGLMPSQHGVHTWLDDSTIKEWPKNWSTVQELQTLPELLSQAGYDTTLMGKYHLGYAGTPQNSFKEWVTLQIGHVQSFYDNKMIVNGKKQTYPGHSVDFFSDQAVDYTARLNEFFNAYSNPKWNLWTGGGAKGNSTSPFLWREIWGEDWKPVYST
jgi:arylsulfatase A-like enzyme